MTDYMGSNREDFLSLFVISSLCHFVMWACTSWLSLLPSIEQLISVVSKFHNSVWCSTSLPFKPIFSQLSLCWCAFIFIYATTSLTNVEREDQFCALVALAVMRVKEGDLAFRLSKVSVLFFRPQMLMCSNAAFRTFNSLGFLHALSWRGIGVVWDSISWFSILDLIGVHWLNKKSPFHWHALMEQNKPCYKQTNLNPFHWYAKWPWIWMVNNTTPWS